MPTAPASILPSPLEESVLRSFAYQGEAQPLQDLRSPLAVWHYRGDGTETGDRAIRSALSKDQAEHIHWDTIATNGRVLVCLPRFRHPAAVEAKPGRHFPAEWFWCFSQIEAGESIEPATPADMATLPIQYWDQVRVLPGVEWLKVREIRFFSHGNRDPRRETKPAPDGLLFFRFTGGVGLAATLNRS